MGVAERRASRERGLDDLTRLVVGRHEDIDAIAGRGRWPARLRPAPPVEGQEHERGEVVQLHEPEDVERLRVGRSSGLEEPPAEVGATPDERDDCDRPQQPGVELPPSTRPGLRRPGGLPVSRSVSDGERLVLLCSGRSHVAYHHKD